MMALAATLALTLYQNGSRVTYDGPAASAAEVLDAIGKKSGVRLEASPQTAGEVLLISVQDVPLNALLARIAQVTAGEWRASGDGYRLFPADAVRRAEGKALRSQRSEALRKSIETRLKAKPEDKTPAQSDRGASGTNDEAILRLLAGSDLGAIASMQSEDRLVFSTSPTRMQRPLGAGSGSIIETLIQRHNAQVAGQKDPTAAIDQAMGGEAPQFLRDLVRQGNQPITSGVAKVDLVIQQIPLVGFKQATLKAYDARGNAAFSATSILNPEAVTRLVAQAMPSKPVDGGAQTPIAFSSDSTAFLKLFGSGGTLGGSGVSLPLTPDLRAKLFHPEAFEPLNLMTADSIRSLAKARGKKEIVACLPDALFPSLLAFRNPSKTVEAFKADLDANESCRVVSDPDYLLVKPTDVEESRRQRVDRAALARLLNAVTQKSVPSLDDIARYAQTNGSPLENPLATGYLTLFAPNAIGQGTGGVTNWNLVRLYGTFDPDQRNAMATGLRLPLGGLQALQRNLVERLVFGSGTSLEVDRGGGTPNADAITRAIQTYAGVNKDYRDEPTEILPDGLPATGVMEIQGSAEGVLQPLPEGGRTSFAVLGPDEIAMMRFMSESPLFKQAAGASLELPPKARLGERRTYAFTFRLAPGVSLAQSLQDNAFPADAPVVSLNELPDTMRKRVEERQAALKNSPIAALGALGGMRKGAAP